MVQYASKVAQICRSTSLARSATKVNKISFNERSSLFGQRCDRVDLQMLASNFFRYRTSDAFCVFAERTKKCGRRIFERDRHFRELFSFRKIKQECKTDTGYRQRDVIYRACIIYRNLLVPS